MGFFCNIVIIFLNNFLIVKSSNVIRDYKFYINNKLNATFTAANYLSSFNTTSKLLCMSKCNKNPNCKSLELEKLSNGFNCFLYNQNITLADLVPSSSKRAAYYLSMFELFNYIFVMVFS